MAESGEADFVETDSDDQLPAGWEERVTDDGTVYYANHDNETTQWTHPVSGNTKFVKGKLPYGWEKKIDKDGGIYYVDTIHGRTTFTDPRLAFAQDNSQNNQKFKQKFDSNSTALDVLVCHDLSDKYIIVTGASSGIGVETVRALAYYGAHVTMACRNMELGHNVREAILADRKDVRIEVMHLELTSLVSVQRFVKEYEKKSWPLHVLILNAATMQEKTETEDGLDAVFQVNFLSQYLLTRLFKDLLVKQRESRVIHVSSESHRFVRSLDHHTLTVDDVSLPAQKYSFMSAYNLSKLCNILFCKELHTRWGQEYGLVSICLHPGTYMMTQLFRKYRLVRWLAFLITPFTKSHAQGAATTVYCAVAPELSSAGGLYINNCCPCDTSDLSKQPQLAKALWDMCDKLLRDKKLL